MEFSIFLQECILTANYPVRLHTAFGRPYFRSTLMILGKNVVNVIRQHDQLTIFVPRFVLNIQQDQKCSQRSQWLCGFLQKTKC
jgi:hypothetical protein